MYPETAARTGRWRHQSKNFCALVAARQIEQRQSRSSAARREHVTCGNTRFLRITFLQLSLEPSDSIAVLAKRRQSPLLTYRYADEFPYMVSSSA